MLSTRKKLSIFLVLVLFLASMAVFLWQVLWGEADEDDSIDIGIKVVDDVASEVDAPGWTRPRKKPGPNPSVDPGQSNAGRKLTGPPWPRQRARLLGRLPNIRPLADDYRAGRFCLELDALGQPFELGFKYQQTIEQESVDSRRNIASWAVVTADQEPGFKRTLQPTSETSSFSAGTNETLLEYGLVREKRTITFLVPVEDGDPELPWRITVHVGDDPRDKKDFVISFLKAGDSKLGIDDMSWFQKVKLLGEDMEKGVITFEGWIFEPQLEDILGIASHSMEMELRRRVGNDRVRKYSAIEDYSLERVGGRMMLIDPRKHFNDPKLPGKMRLRGGAWRVRFSVPSHLRGGKDQVWVRLHIVDHADQSHSITTLLKWQ